MEKVKICIFSGSRADYGLLKCLAQEIKKEKVFELKIIASGSHLSMKLGYTIEEIREDNISHTRRLILALIKMMNTIW